MGIKHHIQGLFHKHKLQLFIDTVFFFILAIMFDVIIADFTDLLASLIIYCPEKTVKMIKT